MSTVARYAYGALDKALAAAVAIAGAEHKNGELTGMGPNWACDQYGELDHDYYTCQECREGYSKLVLRRHTENNREGTTCQI